MAFQSYLWSPISGILSVIFLVVSWGSIFGMLFAIIGIIRKRCPWYAIFIFLAVGIIALLLFKGVFWVSDRIITSDGLITVLFWVSVGIFGLGSLVSFPQLLKELWRSTNRTNNNP